MTSIIKVDNIHNSGGTSAVTVDSSGIVDMPNTVMYDTYRQTANISTNSTTLTSWEKPDDAMAVTVGDSMSEASGIFTFPRTGVYRVAYFAQFDNANGDNVCGVTLEGTTDNSTYDILASTNGGETGTQGTNRLIVSGEAVVNISDTSTRKIRLRTSSISNGSQLLGATDYNRTYICFQYLAPAQ